MWLKHSDIYYNLDCQRSVAFRSAYLVFNVKSSDYLQVKTRFVLTSKEVETVKELFESALTLGNDIFDMDGIYDKFKTLRHKQGR